MAKFCHNCGFENAGKDKFCTKCGAPLLEIEEKNKKHVEPVVQDISNYRTSAVQQDKKKPPLRFQRTSEKMIFGLIVVAIVLSVVAISAAFLVKPNLGANSITTIELSDSSVTSSKIDDGTITDADISSNGISKIPYNAITSNHIVNNSILLIDLSRDLIDSITGLNVIANNSITGEKIANGTITTVDIADSSITSAKITDNTITSSDIATGGVGSSEIEDNSITANDIAAGAVGTSELGNGQVTYDKMAIKIRYGKAQGVSNGSSIAHNLGSTPTSVTVTPIYDSSLGSGNATIIANIISVDSTYFYITLYYQYPGNPLTPVSSGNPVDVYWIAIY
jgi:hypothetical protein